jgi:hypothetical protein
LTELSELEATKEGARLTDSRIQHFVKRARKQRHSKPLMSNGQDETEGIVAQSQSLQIRESELLQRLERLNEANRNTSGTPIATRVFVIGDLVRIKNPRPLQAKQGTVIRIGVDTDRITVQTKNGSKIVRASYNLTHIN